MQEIGPRRSLLAPKISVLWIHDGDRNTAFFHCWANYRWAKNHINRLKSDNGVWVYGDRNVERTFLITLRIYSFLLDQSTATQFSIPLSPGSWLKWINPLIKTFCEKVVKIALFQMDPSTTPSPDGTTFFYQQFWHVVGNGVSNVVLGFLSRASC